MGLCTLALPIKRVADEQMSEALGEALQESIVGLSMSFE
jgi:hypothetical protein